MFTSYFIHSGYFYSASPSSLLLIGAPDYSIDTESELTCRSATANCEWRTCPRSLCGSKSGIRTCDPPDTRQELATVPPRPTTFHITTRDPFSHGHSVEILTVKHSILTVRIKRNRIVVLGVLLCSFQVISFSQQKVNIELFPCHKCCIETKQELD